LTVEPTVAGYEMKDSLLLELAQALSEGLVRRQHFWTALLIVIAL